MCGEWAAGGEGGRVTANLVEFGESPIERLLVHFGIRFVELVLDVGFGFMILVVQLHVQALRPVAVAAASSKGGRCQSRLLSAQRAANALCHLADECRVAHKDQHHPNYAW
jgi:hypothetical protein